MDNEHIEICIKIIEFFKNDPIVIRDFLATSLNTPWDIPYMMKYNIDKEQLVENKRLLLTHIIEKYYEYLKELSREDKLYAGKVKTMDELNEMSSMLEEGKEYSILSSEPEDKAVTAIVTIVDNSAAGSPDSCHLSLPQTGRSAWRCCAAG